MKTRAHSIYTNTKIFWMMIGVSIFAIAIYMYSVNATVRYVAARAEAEAELSERRATIGELEFAYIDMKNKVDLTLAAELGFAAATPSAFVSRTESVALSQGVNSN